MSADALFDYPTVWPGAANTRRSDPLSSHVAADKSQHTWTPVQDAVLTLLRCYGPQTGNDLNDLYRQYRSAHGWPTVSYDSPRKRAGELARDGVVLVTNPDDPRGHPHIYTIKGVS